MESVLFVTSSLAALSYCEVVHTSLRRQGDAGETHRDKSRYSNTPLSLWLYAFGPGATPASDFARLSQTSATVEDVTVNPDPAMAIARSLRSRSPPP